MCISNRSNGLTIMIRQTLPGHWSMLVCLPSPTCAFLDSDIIAATPLAVDDFYLSASRITIMIRPVQEGMTIIIVRMLIDRKSMTTIFVGPNFFIRLTGRRP